MKTMMLPCLVWQYIFLSLFLGQSFSFYFIQHLALFVWLMMNLIVLPITNVPKFQVHLFEAIKGISILIIAVGFPLAHFAHNYYQGNVKRTGREGGIAI
ncbi:hypothetical protein [Parapedobacter koreensis]|uniref:Uncharacterized protein n=1 Tax=Parapedobacter koreensis TaxID=332977 RepID=A0A1H7UHE0_9SPHI|nr:hypothetical protein [Parapedobacter koreensis]SEL96154.1 hypothetical protein SAMN05421740_11564 [Parapedobacter koreensis]